MIRLVSYEGLVQIFRRTFPTFAYGSPPPPTAPSIPPGFEMSSKKWRSEGVKPFYTHNLENNFPIFSNLRRVSSSCFLNISTES